jgi:hypothetical protein
MPNQDDFWLRIIYIVSVVISAAIAFLILGPRPEGIEGALDVSALPLVNATLNGITTILLLVQGGAKTIYGRIYGNIFIYFTDPYSFGCYYHTISIGDPLSGLDRQYRKTS